MGFQVLLDLFQHMRMAFESIVLRMAFESIVLRMALVKRVFHAPLRNAPLSNAPLRNAPSCNAAHARLT